MKSTKMPEQLTKVLLQAGLECVTNGKNANSFQCCIKDEGRAPHIRPAGGVYKPLHGAVIKSYGIER
ncbi:MAG: hypothetical protein WKG06_29115 [Segetibacter sp.]